MFVLQQPLHLNECGKRASNQDSIYPPAGRASAKDKLFLVCDGVGGSQRGDLASQLVCKYFPEYFSLNPTENITPAYLDNGLKYTEQKLREFITQNKEAALMATTLTLLYISEKGCTVAWCGDSRVYLLNKQGKIKFRTNDHSLVRSMVESGELTEEQAKTHPQKNVIIRAINPGKGNASLETHFIATSQIEDGDYFLLCSDGIWEYIDAQFDNIIGHSANNQAINNAINKICQHQSHDNFSSYLVQLSRVGDKAAASPTVPVTSAAATEPILPPKKIAQKKVDKKWIVIPVALAFVSLIGIVLAVSLNKKQEPRVQIDQEVINNIAAADVREEPVKNEPDLVQEKEQTIFEDTLESIVEETNEVPITEEKKTSKSASSLNFESQKALQETYQKNKDKRAQEAKLLADDTKWQEEEAEQKKAEEDAQQKALAESKKIEDEKMKSLSLANENMEKHYWFRALNSYKKAMELETKPTERGKLNVQIQLCKTQMDQQSASENLEISEPIAKLSKDLYYNYIVNYSFNNKSDRAISVAFMVLGGYYADDLDVNAPHSWNTQTQKEIRDTIPALTQKVISVQLTKLKFEYGTFIPKKDTKKIEKIEKVIRFVDGY